MSYKSDSQRKLFHALEARGEIKSSTVHEFDEASKGMKLPEHVKKLYEGGLIDDKEYGDFKSRYDLQDGEKESQDKQEQPSFSTDSGSRYEPHNDSPLPSDGYDEEMTQKVGEENQPSDDADPFSRQEFASELRREKRRKMFRGGH